MNPAILQLPFVQVALPILLGIFLTIQVSNKRMDDLRNDFNKRIDDLRSDFARHLEEIIKRSDRIESKLDNHEGRLIKFKAAIH